MIIRTASFGKNFASANSSAILSTALLLIMRACKGLARLDHVRRGCTRPYHVVAGSRPFTNFQLCGSASGRTMNILFPKCTSMIVGVRVVRWLCTSSSRFLTPQRLMSICEDKYEEFYGECIVLRMSILVSIRHQTRGPALVWSPFIRLERKGLEQCVYQTRSAVQKY